ncbi:ribonuclease III [Acidihalobacter prosperus]|uniref:Ribonuclease 3 n=1 Tax=Acidihalobacter prosperus TaxID=160660 RepID=A0A1A6C779_9GAMM|nr:ribonuclease III [Acidihalobacter prosperus]OBS10405.1 ribonuclease III [Acidihalobacter prosperus]
MTEVNPPDWLPAELRASPLCLQALTHRSVGGSNYERLEFLGDALLGLIVAEWLYAALPKASEGELSRVRASLVKRETLAGIARERDLGERLRLGQGELKSGGFRRDSILADVVEALIGAHYLVLGFTATQDFVRLLFGERFERLPSAESLKDPKTRLQERLQSTGMALPIYDIVEATGEPHQQTFRVRCALGGDKLAVEAVGSSRRKAEQASAEAMLALLNEQEGKKRVR